jgi:hypothetical protein
VDVPGVSVTQNTIASLPLDEGKYAIQAKLYISDTTELARVICRLSAGADSPAIPIDSVRCAR